MSIINRAFSVHHACGLSITPTLSVYLYYADATAYAQVQSWKGSSSHKTALCVAILRYRAHRVCALRALVRKVEKLCKTLATLSVCTTRYSIRNVELYLYMQTCSGRMT